MENAVIKLQANIRGFLQRRALDESNSMMKNKTLSIRALFHCTPLRFHKGSVRNIIIFSDNELDEMPDYSTHVTRQIEERLGAI